MAAAFIFELIISFHCSVGSSSGRCARAGALCGSVAGAMANLKDRLAIVFSKHTGPPQDDELVAFGKKAQGRNVP